jgi:hypothetical protein
VGGVSDVPTLAADKILPVPKVGSSLVVEFLTGLGPWRAARERHPDARDPRRVVDVKIEQQMERRVPAAGTCGVVWIRL